MQSLRLALSAVLIAGVVGLFGLGRGAEARTELHEIVAADMTEPEQWSRVTDFGDGQNAGDDSAPLTEEQQFRQHLYYELHPERVPHKAEAKIRFVEAGADVEADAEAGGEAEAEAEAETEAETDAEADAEAESETDAEAEGEAETEEDAEGVAAMEPLANAEEGESQANARYAMDSMLHSGFQAPVPAHTQPAITLDSARFAQVSAAAEVATAAHAAQQQTALSSSQMLAATWTAEKQAALDAFLDADNEEDDSDDEDEDEADADADEHAEAAGMLEMRAEQAHGQRFGRGATSRMGMGSDRGAAMAAADEDIDMGEPREYDADAADTSDLAEAQAQVDAASGQRSERVVARAAGHRAGHDKFGGDMRFSRVHAPLPKDPDSRLYYARSRRGEKIRRMIRRGEMLYRYAPELMSKVFDPARRVDKPGVTPTFGMAMDGPLGPVTPPPPGGAAKPKKGSQGPAFFEMAEHAYTAQQAAQHAAGGMRMRGDDDEASGGKEEGGDKSEGEGKGGAGAKGSKEWIKKQMSQIDTLIKNPYAQAEKYPQMYEHWDNYMFPLRNRPIPPRWYPYPQKGRNPIASFPPAQALFENPPQRGPLQTPNPLFQNPRGVGGLQPLAAPFAPIGQPSAPSPYASPLGFNAWPGAGVPTGPDAANNGLLGPKNHPVFSAHPLPLQKWYQKFLQPAEPPKMTAAPGKKAGGEDAEGGEGGGGEESE